MFIGHLAIGFASKRVAPWAGLAPLMAAPVLLDLLWPVLVLAGLEEVRVAPGYTAATPLEFVSYPWSHSLAAALAWGGLFGAVYLVRTRYLAGAVVVSLGVVSHWVLDLATHVPDLPLWPGGPRHGLGLWTSVPATVAVEVTLYAVGVALYASATRPRNRTGAVALWSFVIFAGAIYVGNLLGPPPPSARAVALLGLAQWLWIPWAALIDRNRVLRAEPAPALAG